MRLFWGWAPDWQTCGDPGLAHGAERTWPLPLASSPPTTHGTLETSSETYSVTSRLPAAALSTASIVRA